MEPGLAVNILRILWRALTWRGRLHFLWQDLRPRAWWRHHLVRRYPELFRYPDWHDPRQSLMEFGFEHGDGGGRILRRMARDLRQIEREMGTHSQIQQLKEKFGTLHVYFTADGPPAGQAAVEAVIDAAERASETVCEDCGRRGELMRRGLWYRTVCSRCAARQGYEPIPPGG